MDIIMTSSTSAHDYTDLLSGEPCRQSNVSSVKTFLINSMKYLLKYNRYGPGQPEPNPTSQAH